MAYSYTPLQNANSIRLLYLESGSGNTPLKAYLKSYRLGDQSYYESLSYAWGERDLTKLLIVDDHEFKISKNLHTILLQLRYPDKIRTLWIDAICINQRDDVEKGQQILLMGQVYEKADTVLCWLGELSLLRLRALKFLQSLAEEAPKYLKPEPLECYWTVLNDELVPGVDVNFVMEAALEAHVEAIYENDWFTRLWIVQELALARSPIITCGTYDLSWKEFELATRIIGSCLGESSDTPSSLRSFKDAWDIISLRGRYSLNMRPITARPVHFHIDQPWSIGRLVWDMRDKKCKDDRDRVYAVLSLTANGNSLKAFVPDSFTPDYSRPVEWVYCQFWRRFGGYTSLFYAGLSRRRCHSKTDESQTINKAELVFMKDDYLPSWAPDLRPHCTNDWKPVFGLDYATSTPMHHMAANLTKGPGILMMRGHRFDVVVRGFHISHQIRPCEKLKDFINFRTTIKFFLSLESKYKPYPSGQPWIEALGSTLITDMPYENNHPFQKYLDTFHLNIKLSDDELQRIWKLYQDLLLADTGDVWTKFCSMVLSQKASHLDPFVELTHDGQLAWMLHKYIGDVLQAHRLIIMERGYMGLAPPNTAVGDVVVAFGGPAVPFVVRDTSIVMNGGIVADGAKGIVVPDKIERVLSQLLGPCYLQGIMKAELFEDEMYKTDFEWDTDKLGTVPKPTLWLI